jgi:hypothetical protein
MVVLVRVFVSYSNESTKHSSRVLELTNQLRASGIDAQIDRYVTSPVEGWPRWIYNQISAADFVICVCTPTYRQAFEGRNDPERGLGVNAEGYAIMQDLYDRGNASQKYIPITFGSAGRHFVPSALRAFTFYQMPGEYAKMLDRLTDGSSLSFMSSGQSSAESLPVANEVGYAGQSDISEYIRPESYSLDRLAPSSGLYVSRIINEFRDEKVMTVWVACRGGLQYVLDSARVYKHWTGGAGPLAAVAVPPDARYRFTYDDSSDYEAALDPALSIGPQTRDFASFTVSAAPSEPIYGFGNLYISIQYHVSNGRRGSILLDDPLGPGVALAKLVGQDVLIATHEGRRTIAMVVSPDGLQHGLEEGCEPPMQAEFLDPLFGIASLLKLPRVSNEYGNITTEQLDNLEMVRAQAQERLRKRRDLYKSLSFDNRIEELSGHLAKGEKWAADLIGGMATDSATAIIERALASNPSDQIAFYGLCVRHIANPDAKLADFVIANYETLDYWSADEAACAAVALAPGSDFADMFRLLTRRGQVMASSIVTIMRSQLPGDDWDHMVDAIGGPLGELWVRDSSEWYQQPQANMRLRYEGRSRYKAVLLLPPERICFKIVDFFAGTNANWVAGTNANWGKSDPELPVLLEHSFELRWSQYVIKRDEQGKVLGYQGAHMSHNQIALDLSAEISAANYVFELDASDMLHPALVISREQHQKDVEHS